MSLFSRTVPEAVEARQLREARVRAARSCEAWREVSPPERLCPRGPKRYGWHVDADTDEVFVLHAGTAFLPHSAAIVADRTPLSFTVNADGQVAVFERVAKPRTWSDVVAANPELAAK